MQAIQTVDAYLLQLPKERSIIVQNLFNTVKNNLPNGFEATINYGMLGFVVPYSIYPNGYHCKPKQPLPFIHIASQKNFIALYHMGIYAKPDLLDWFVQSYPKFSTRKLDMGKSCVRFKHLNEIPLELIALLSQKMTVQDWIETYENAFLKK